MNTYIFYSLFFLLPFLQGNQRNHAFTKNDDVDSIIVYKLSSYTTYTRGVDCRSIRNHVDIRKFDLTKFKNRILSYLSDVHPIYRTTYIDARGYIEIWHKSGAVDTFCNCRMSYASVNRQTVELGPELNRLLDSVYDHGEDKLLGK